MNLTSQSRFPATICVLILCAGLIFSGVAKPVSHDLIGGTAVSAPELVNRSYTEKPNPSLAAREAESKYLREDSSQRQQPALIESSRQPSQVQEVLYSHGFLPNRAPGQATFGGTPTRANPFFTTPVEPGPSSVFSQTDTRAQSLVPEASFIFSPSNPDISQVVQFASTSTGPNLSLEWDFDGDDFTDSTSLAPTYRFNAPGPYRVTLQVTNPYGRHSTNKIIFVGAPGNSPLVTNVFRTYEHYYLQGMVFDNYFDTRVDWRGMPGSVKFELNNRPPIIKPGNALGAVQSFNLNNDFTPDSAPSILRITPTNAAGLVGSTIFERVYVFNYPTWLADELDTDTSVIKFSAVNGAIIAKINFEFPKPHLGGNVNIPPSIPFLGGGLGLTETFAYIRGEFSSRGTGSLNVGGQTGFQGMGSTLKGSVSGNGTFLLDRSGLKLQSASLMLQINGSVRKETRLVVAIPALAPLTGFPLIGSFFRSATLTGEASAALAFAAYWEQDQNQHLKFKEGTGSLDLALKATLAANISRHIKAKAWVGGSGNVKVGVPASPFMRELGFSFEVGVAVTGDGIFRFINYSKRAGYGCKWTPATGTRCASSPFAPEFNPQEAETKAPSVALIEPDYDRFGPYSVFQRPAQDARQINSAADSGTPQAMPESTIVSNVFLEAKPHFIKVGNSGRMLLWVQQDPALPVLQSTNISYTFDDGSGWSAPANIASDTRAESQPVAAQDIDGNVVAVWTRVKNPNFTTPITTIEELPLYYKEFEVVSSTFNIVTRTWGAITPLTDDAAFDTSQQLVLDDSGHLLLTWLSNADGLFTSSASSPSVLKYSRRGGGNWSVPTSLPVPAGVSEFVAEVSRQSFIIMPRDPHPELPDDGVLDLYLWNGVTWNPAGTFASGGGDNHSPSVVSDSAGGGHVVWTRGDNLVHATLSNPTPSVVRGGSSAMSFYDTTLLNNAQGVLTLLWEGSVDNGPANIFATLYDPNSQTWSADRRLNVDERLAHDVTGYYGTDGKLNLAYLSTEVLRTTRTIVLDGENVTIQNIPDDGQTDLCLLQLILSVDLSVTNKDLTLNFPTPRPGDMVEATLTLHNAGDFAVSNFNINLYAGDPAAGGVLLESRRVNGPLVAAADMTHNFSFVYPQSGGDIVAVVDAGNEIAESAENNNRATVFLNNTAPHAIVSANVTGGTSPLAVNFSAAASYDDDGDALDFIWTFADGSPNQTGVQASHTFNQVGLYPVTVMATDSRGAVGTAQVLINVGCSDLAFFPPLLAVGRLGAMYNQTVSANGGSAPYSFAVTSGSLPPGLTLSASGALTGVPTSAGTYAFTISAIYANGCPGSHDYTMLINQVRANSIFDFDGDGKTDVAVFRPSTSGWYIQQSQLGFASLIFGANGDKPAPGDYDGDGKTDTAVFRPANASWYILDSSNAAFHATQFGQTGDSPAAADYDGDGKTDIAIFRPSTGTFYVLYSSDNSFHYQQWGTTGDVPVMGDYDGDRKIDFAIYRPSSSTFYILQSSNGTIIGQQWGTAGDKPISGDFDGDGRTDICVYRPSAGAWYYRRSIDNSFRAIAWGTNGDVPVVGYYDGDAKYDVSIFRPSTGAFYILQSATNALRSEQFGANGDLPVAAAYVP